MNLEVLESKDLELNFIIRDITPTIANTLRRLMITEVPVLAIEKVNFIKNNSALYEEVIAHRLGLVPLKTDLKSYNLREECSCKGEGCVKCQLNFTLDVKGPVTVYSSDLKSQDPEISPVVPNLSITLLLKGQKMELEATARLGKGKEHAKFSPCHVYFKAVPLVQIKKTEKVPKGLPSLCPVDILVIENEKLKVTDPLKCILCRACEDSSPDSIHIEESKTDFIFSVESWGQLKPKEILEQAVKVFDDKLEEFNKKFKKAK